MLLKQTSLLTSFQSTNCFRPSLVNLWQLSLKMLMSMCGDIPYDPRLLVWLLERLAATGGLERRFTGSTIKHFTRESFIELPVPLPSVAEQERIVAEVERRLSVVEELSALVTANLQRATRLRQSILQRAFEGKLVKTSA